MRGHSPLDLASKVQEAGASGVDVTDGDCTQDEGRSDIMGDPSRVGIERTLLIVLVELEGAEEDQVEINVLIEGDVYVRGAGRLGWA